MPEVGTLVIAGNTSCHKNIVIQSLQRLEARWFWTATMLMPRSIQDDVVVQTCKHSFAHTCAQVSLDCTARAFRAVTGGKDTPYGVLLRLRKLGFLDEAKKLARLNAVTSTTARGNQHKSKKKNANQTESQGYTVSNS